MRTSFIEPTMSARPSVTIFLLLLLVILLLLVLLSPRCFDVVFYVVIVVGLASCK